MLSTILGIIVGVVVYVIIVEPWATKTCLLNSQDCVKVKYKTKNGTLLAYETTSGKYVWFDGNEILLYGQPVGSQCDAPYQSAYVWDLKSKEPKGYLCAKSIDDILEIYKDEPYQYFSKRTVGTYDLVDLVNVMMDRKLLKIKV